MPTSITKHIPNAITCGNLLCGCMGIAQIAEGNAYHALLWMIGAAVLDFFDGFVARLLHVQSAIGKDLDSLADCVTFGVLPGFMMHYLLTLGATASVSTSEIWHQYLLSLLAFLVPVFSALRLAKFNNDPRQSDSFIGLPTPINALFIGSLAYMAYSQKVFFTFGILQAQLDSNSATMVSSNVIAVALLILVLCILLICELPLFALKFKSFGWSENKLRYIFMLMSAALLLKFNFAAFFYIMPLYILLSIVNNKLELTNLQK